MASFIAHEIYQRLVANGAEEAKELGRGHKLLQETIAAYHSCRQPNCGRECSAHLLSQWQLLVGPINPKLSPSS
jgi:hypothetical protein